MGEPEFVFNARSETAQTAAAKHAAKLVLGISEETKKAIRALIVKSMREGIPPLEAARMIRGSIGMTTTQALAAANYRASLRLGGLSEDRVDRAVAFYSARKIRERAEVIARTETLGALNAGSLESWKQAQKQGFLSKSARKKWITTPDEHLCSICRPVDRQEQPLNKPFVLANGTKTQFPPAHPSCRCTIGEPTIGPSSMSRSGRIVLDTLPKLAQTLNEFNILGPENFPVGLSDLARFERGTIFDPETWEGRQNLVRAHTSLTSMNLAGRLLREAEALLQAPVGFVLEKMGTDQYAVTNSRTDPPTIITNLDSPIWLGRDRLVQLLKRGFMSNPGSPESIFVHEYGHASWKRFEDFPYTSDWSESSLGAFFRKHGRSPRDFQLLTARSVSPYADSAIHEFIAETFSALVFGRSLPKDILWLYDTLGGPRIGRRKA